MNLIIGGIIVLGSVLGGFVLEEGQLMALFQPYELLIVFGAAFGGFVVANPPKVVKGSFVAIPRLLAKDPYNKKAYLDLLSLLYKVAIKIRKAGLMSVEQDLDAPETSELFAPFPHIRSNQPVMDFLIDNLRLIVSGNIAAHDFEALLDTEIETREEELEKPAHAITSMGDSFPGFGIVAAVLGIVITMGFLGGDPKELGHHVASALVGTMLGILISYGFVGPLGSAVGHMAKKEIKYFCCIKVFLLAIVAGTAPILSVEYARRGLYSDVKPGFLELEAHVKRK